MHIETNKVFIMQCAPCVTGCRKIMFIPERQFLPTIQFTTPPLSIPALFLVFFFSRPHVNKHPPFRYDDLKNRILTAASVTLTENDIFYFLFPRIILRAGSQG